MRERSYYVDNNKDNVYSPKSRQPEGEQRGRRVLAPVNIVNIK